MSLNVVEPELRKRVFAVVAECMAKASAYYGRHFNMPNILFTKRGTTAGTASKTAGGYTVNYNPILLNENVEDFIARTVPHEMAHIIDMEVNPKNHQPQVIMTRSGRYKRAKRDIHGADFRFIMEKVLNVDDSTRCHNYDVSRARTKVKARYIWVCDQLPDITMTLGPKQHAQQLIFVHQGKTGYMPRGKKLRRGIHTFSYSHKLGTQPPAPKPIAADTSLNPITVQTPTSTTASKLDKCRAAFDPNKSRADNIHVFISLGCTPKGAATYYAKIKKE